MTVTTFNAISACIFSSRQQNLLENQAQPRVQTNVRGVALEVHVTRNANQSSLTSIFAQQG